MTNVIKAVKKLEFGWFCRDFLADFKIHPLAQRNVRCKSGWILKDAKKIGENNLNLYFFTALNKFTDKNQRLRKIFTLKSK